MVFTPLKWLECADGSFPSGLDLIHLPFPNLGAKVLPRTSNVCWQGKPFDVPDILQPFITQYESSNPHSTITHLYDCILCMLLSSSICIFVCCILHSLLNRFHFKYSQIRPVHKKWYVVVNIMKGFVLGAMILNSQFLRGVWTLLSNGEIPLLETKRTTALYVMTDLIGLILIPKLPFSTFMHHVMSVFIGMGIWSTDINAQSWTGALGAIKMSFLYGSFSCIPFTVNIFLGMRIIYGKERRIKLLCYFALLSYIISIGINWTLHILWLYNCFKMMDFSPLTLFYGGILIHIIRDDIILIKFLWSFPSSGKQG